MPKWVREPFDDYITRLNPGLKVSLTEIERALGPQGVPPTKAIETEGHEFSPLCAPMNMSSRSMKHGKRDDHSRACVLAGCAAAGRQ